MLRSLLLQERSAHRGQTVNETYEGLKKKKKENIWEVLTRSTTGHTLPSVAVSRDTLATSLHPSTQTVKYHSDNRTLVPSEINIGNSAAVCRGVCPFSEFHQSGSGLFLTLLCRLQNVHEITADILKHILKTLNVVANRTNMFT